MSSFTGMWAYPCNVLTFVFSHRLGSSIAINILLPFKTLCYSLIISPNTAGLLCLSDRCTAGKSCTAHQAQKPVSDQSGSTADKQIRQLFNFFGTHADPLSLRHKKIELCVTLHACLICLYRKLYVKDINKDFGTFLRIRHHKHPATAFVHKNKATSV